MPWTTQDGTWRDFFTAVLVYIMICLPVVSIATCIGRDRCELKKQFIQRCKERKNLSVNMIKKCKADVWDNEILSEDELSEILRNKN